VATVDRRSAARSAGRAVSRNLVGAVAAPRRGVSYAAPAAPGGRAFASPWHRPRLDPDFAEEQVFWDHGYRLVAGLDEVGRGCLAGPVMVGAVILPPGWLPDGLRDSKILKADARERLADEILRHAVAWAVAAVEPAVIDRVNILQATLLAVQLAASRLPVRPDALLLDGSLHLDGISLPQRVVIDDRLMVELDARYPGYDLAHNKGYAAPEHRAGLRELGTTSIHRLTFASCADVEQTVLWEAVGPGDDEVADDSLADVLVGVADEEAEIPG
jgi:ribonuclease HII